MRKAIAVLSAALALGLVSLPAAAQQQTYPYSNEFSIFGFWNDLSEPEDVETSFIALRYGRFLRPQTLATFTLDRLATENGQKTSTTTWLVGAKYYFSQPRAQAMVPFVNAGIGLASVDTGPDDGTDLAWEIGGGLSFFFSQQTSFDAGLRFFHTDTDAETRGVGLLVGLTMRF